MTKKTYSVQTIAVPLKVGSRVTLVEDVDIDSDEGSRASVSFEDYVTKYSPETGKIEFERSEIGLAEFERRIEAADGIEIVKE